MKFSGFTSYRTGILIPVFSLKSCESEGCGDFLDLISLGTWCRQSGLNIVQLLPVNDTGSDPSPYSALSAYALHPIFIRVSALPEYSAKLKMFAGVRDGIEELRGLNAEERVDYHKILDRKIGLLRDIYNIRREKITADEELSTWIQENPWVREYAVFKHLKDENSQSSWLDWQVETPDVGKYWDEKDVLFYAWIQFRLEQQFSTAGSALFAQGIMLKGDIPILMNEDSVDVWTNRELFHLDKRAGAPPDMFSALGQNWGFPIYNWEALAQQDYRWWKQRLIQADKFYQAYRVDHVLGFFRIWTIPSAHREGILGYFYPSKYVSMEDLKSAGFDEGRIRWLAEPHLYGGEIRNAFKEDYPGMLEQIFSRIGNEDLFMFSAQISGERDILALPYAPEHIQTLLDMYRDRALIAVGDDEYFPAWSFRSCSRYDELSDDEKYRFEEMVSRSAVESEGNWEQAARTLLGFMQNTTGMLTCAEDLGVIPGCVPRVLDDLEILSLKIPRWARRWGQPGEPYIPHGEYPFLSVCAPSVHDTSTLRDWWEHEDGRELFWESLGFTDPCPSAYDAETARRVIKALMDCSSAIAVFQLQDFFAIEKTYRVEDSRAERINIPGTVQPSNWSYRMPVTMETLIADESFSSAISTIASARNLRKIH